MTEPVSLRRIGGLKSALVKAIAADDPTIPCAFATVCRTAGLSYAETFNLARESFPELELTTWEAMLSREGMEIKTWNL